MTADTLEKIVLLLIKVPNLSTVRAACLDNLKIPAERVDAAIAEARLEITRAADVHRDEEFGKAVKRLENLFSDSNKIKDYKTALAVQKDLSRLIGLYPTGTQQAAETGESEESAALARIREHLEPLDLAPPGTPVEELVRLATLIVFETRYAEKQPEFSPRSDEATEPDEIDPGSGDFADSGDQESEAAGDGEV